jgi:hypothetical protein
LRKKSLQLPHGLKPQPERKDFIAALGALRHSKANLSPNCPVRSAAHIARIQAAGYGGVGGSFDDGAAVREDRQVMFVAREPQSEFV